MKIVYSITSQISQTESNVRDVVYEESMEYA